MVDSGAAVDADWEVAAVKEGGEAVCGAGVVV